MKWWVGVALCGCWGCAPQPWTGTASVRAVQAVGTEEAWFAGSHGVFGWSEDGGRSWQVDSVQAEDGSRPEFRSLAVTAEAVHVLAVGRPARLFRSVDRGRTWSVVYREDADGVFYDAMRFLDDRTGLAWGDPVGGCMSVLRSEDGGATWTKLPCADLPPALPGEAAFAASNGNIAVQGDSVWCASTARVWISGDRGQSWEVVPTPIAAAAPMQGLFALEFFGGGRGIGVGGDWEHPDDATASKVGTWDGGRTWIVLTPGEGPGYRDGVRAVPGTTGPEVWSVSARAITRSADGGSTWEQVEAPVPGAFTVDFSSNGRRAYLAGKGFVLSMRRPR